MRIILSKVPSISATSFQNCAAGNYLLWIIILIMSPIIATAATSFQNCAAGNYLIASFMMSAMMSMIMSPIYFHLLDLTR